MTRRNNGDGSYRTLPNGNQEYRVTVDGIRVSATGRTKLAARRAAEKKVERVRAGEPPCDSRITVGQLLDHWKTSPLDARSTRRGPLKQSTKDQYRNLIALYLAGRHDPQNPENDIAPDPIARVRLDKISKDHIAALIGRLRDRGIAESTIRATYHVLRLALDNAVDNELLRRNPMHKIARPVAGDDEARHLEPAEVVRLLTAAREPRLELTKRSEGRTRPYVRNDQSRRYWQALALIAGTGMRRGEALGLTWQDVDLLDGTVRIRGTLARIDGRLQVTSTKTKHSERTVPLSPSLVDILAAWKDEQERERDKVRRMYLELGCTERTWRAAAEAENAWTDTGFVFTTEHGQPVDPRNLLRTLHHAAKRAKIDGVTIHTLRHSFLSAGANAGEPIANLAEIAGHSDMRITQRYLHTNDDGKKTSTLRTAELFGL